MSALGSAALLRAAALGVTGLVLCAALVAGWQGGAMAVLAVVVGALLTGASVVAMAQGLAAILGAGISAATGGRWAVLGFIVRHAGVAAAVYLALRSGLPAPWLLVGVTAWPIALGVAGFKLLTPAGSAARSEGVPARALRVQGG